LGGYSFHRYGSNEYIFCKNDAGGLQYNLRQSAAGVLRLSDGVVNPTLAVTLTLETRSLCVTMGDGIKAEGFVDGSSAGLFTAANTISADDAPITVGSYYTGTSPTFSRYSIAVLYPGQLSATDIAAFHAYSQSLITPRKQWPGGGLRYPDRGDPYVPATGDPMYIANIQSARVTLANQTSGQLSNTGLQIIAGTWALTESAAGRAITCVGAGKLRRRLIGADGFTTHRFDATGTAALIKNTTNVEIDAGNGDTITAVHLTAP
jgi:hypothetical protein